MPDNEIFVDVEEFFNSNKNELKLRLVSGKKGLHNKISTIDCYRPGLAFAGYTVHYNFKAIQILGTTEIEFINSISQRKRSKNLKNIFQYKIPCFIVSKNLEIPKILKILSNDFNIPIFICELDTSNLIHKITAYLLNRLAKSFIVHGTLVDIYGIGILITGKSGIGKSEAALDLIERGHRLVADDAVRVYKKSDHLLMGTGIAPESNIQHHMEVRGIGILDIAKIFGIRGVRLHKRIEIEVNLIEWSSNIDIERVGITESNINYFDIEIPLVKIALLPGKNISVIIEIIALNHILKLSGHDTAKIFNATLIKLMRDKANKLARLDEDEE